MKRYYSARNSPQALSLGDLYKKTQHLYLYFRDKDYFKSEADITKSHLPDAIKHKAAMNLGFDAFPVNKWDSSVLTEEHVFDIIEFLHDHASKPGELVDMTRDGWNYQDYESYDKAAGQAEFRAHANGILADFPPGFELMPNGHILTAGVGGLKAILDAEIVPYDEANVDSKVRSAIIKWRNRQLDMKERREAIREMADVFEWLQKNKQLARVLNKKDESALFDIANNFYLRHHNPIQKKDYDPEIWYPWMFHFYLATYHAAIRLLKRVERRKI